MKALLVAVAASALAACGKPEAAAPAAAPVAAAESVPVAAAPAPAPEPPPAPAEAQVPTPPPPPAPLELPVAVSAPPPAPAAAPVAQGLGSKPDPFAVVAATPAARNPEGGAAPVAGAPQIAVLWTAYLEIENDGGSAVRVTHNGRVLGEWRGATRHDLQPVQGRNVITAVVAPPARGRVNVFVRSAASHMGRQTQTLNLVEMHLGGKPGAHEAAFSAD